MGQETNIKDPLSEVFFLDDYCFYNVNNNLVPLIEGLCSSNLYIDLSFQFLAESNRRPRD